MTNQDAAIVNQVVKPRTKRTKWLRRAGLIGLGVLLLLGITQNSWLPPFAAYLDVGEPPRKADFIVVLGGGDGNRAFSAIDLYHQGLAPMLLVSGLGKGLRLDRSIMAQAGVSPSVMIINDHPYTTWDEAQQVLGLLHAQNAHSALIVTDAYHTRRARATYEQLPASRDIDLTFVDSSDAFVYREWWQDADGRAAVLSEYVKMVYYFVRYGVRSWA